MKIYQLTSESIGGFGQSLLPEDPGINWVKPFDSFESAMEYAESVYKGKKEIAWIKEGDTWRSQDLGFVMYTVTEVELGGKNDVPPAKEILTYNKGYRHIENGLVQEEFRFYNVGFSITTSIATGVAGEATCLIIHDSNIYPDGDSRSQRPNEYIIPIDDTNDLKNLCKSIKKALKERKKTLIKNSENN